MSPRSTLPAIFGRTTYENVREPRILPFSTSMLSRTCGSSHSTDDDAGTRIAFGTLPTPLNVAVTATAPPTSDVRGSTVAAIE
jgi:hypothetical protein